PRAVGSHPGHARRPGGRRRATRVRDRGGDRPDDGRRAVGPRARGLMRAPLRLRAGWVVPAVLPALNLAAALALSALSVLSIGEHPARALRLLVGGAFGSVEALGYTLFYATDFVFTGLAVAVAFHAGLFNIGADGQAHVGGLAVGLLCLGAGGWPT